MQKTKIHLISCHRRADRSFFYGGRQFPVCARCTGMLIGYAAYPLMLFRLTDLGLLANLMVQIPILLDGGSQALGWRESNNTLRVLTGLLSGVGQAGMVVYAGRYLAQAVLSLRL